MTPSLRNRLLIRIVAATILLLTIFSLTVYFVISNTLANQFDASLASVARILAASVEIDAGRIELEFAEHEIPELKDEDHPIYYQFWKSDDTAAGKSPLLGDDSLTRLEGDLNIPVFAKSHTADNRPLRTVGLAFKPRGAEEGEEHSDPATSDQILTIVVARDATELLGQLRFLRWLLISAAVTVTILSLVIAAVVVREGLAPLAAIAAEIAEIDQKNLAARIEAAAAPSEIVPIKDTLNDLLAGLEDAFKRERRFTADVAHELRTPLAGLRSTIEVTLSRQRDGAEYQTALSDSLAIVDDMNTMVGNLLMLARLDAHQVAFAAERIKLAELVASSWRPFADKAEQRRITFDNDIPADLICQSDPEHLSIVFRNLLENAVDYSNQAGRIGITARRTEDAIEVTLSNTGCKLTAEQVSKAFDSFWRADQSRSDPAIHAGLGLALVKRITTALGGAITAKIDRPDTFKITLTLPLSFPRKRESTS